MEREKEKKKQTSSIPESDAVSLLVDHRVDGVVVKDSGHILPRKLVVDIADQQTRLADRAVANDNNLNLI